METYTLERDGLRDLRFEGELLAEVSSPHGELGPRRWTELRLHRLKDGRHVLETVERNDYPNERDQCAAVVVAADPEAVIASVEQDGKLERLGRELLLEAGIEPVEEV